jgi:hypothetical protein
MAFAQVPMFGKSGKLCRRAPECPLAERRVYAAHRLKISEPFVPPNPKEFDSAMSTFALRE